MHTATIYAQHDDGTLFRIGTTEVPAELSGHAIAVLLRSLADEYERATDAT